MFLYHTSKCKQTKEQGSENFSGPIFLPFHIIIVSFFSLFSQDAQKTGLNWDKKKHKLAQYKTQSGEPDYVDHRSFFKYFARSYLYNNLGKVIKTLQSRVAVWCMYCMILRLHDIKQLQSPLNTPSKYILLIYYTFLSKRSLHFSVVVQVYLFFCYTFYEFKINGCISSST